MQEETISKPRAEDADVETRIPLKKAHDISSVCPCGPEASIQYLQSFRSVVARGGFGAWQETGGSLRDGAFTVTAQLLTNPTRVLDEDDSQVIAFQPTSFQSFSNIKHAYSCRKNPTTCPNILYTQIKATQHFLK